MIGAGIASFAGGFFRDQIGDYHLVFISAAIMGIVASGLTLSMTRKVLPVRVAAASSGADAPARAGAVKITPREIEAHLATLQSTPAVLSRVSSDLDDVRLRQRPQPGQWSLIELLAHLSACAEIWGDDIREMLSCDIPTLTKPHPRGVMNEAAFSRTVV